MRKPTILLADKDPGLRRNLAQLLRGRGMEVAEPTDSAGIFRAFKHTYPDLVIVGSLDAARTGLEVAREIRKRYRRIPLILMPAQSTEELAIEALRAGVTDYFRPPPVLEEVAASAARCLTDSFPGDRSTRAGAGGSSLAGGQRMVGESQPMREILAYIEKVAPTDSTVLLTGETGTGKEVAAELIHGHSARRHKPFVCINCVAIPDSLLESELFGYERGAFTGAEVLREGKLKLADGGTAFFDEIGDMTPTNQSKILRAIETKEVHRLGGRGGVPLNIRVIAATNRDLERLVAEDKFRKDLYFRLNVARIHLPPLRDRKEDIPALLDHYTRESNRRLGLGIEGFTEETLEFLLRYPWPGNVRELKNLIEAIFVNSPSLRITCADLPEQFQRRLNEAEGLPRDERERLLSALFATNWNKSRAAQKLHWSRMTVYRKMTKYLITRTGAVTGERSM